MPEKCLHGKTQNANEFFHGTIWNRLPKETYVEKTQFELGVHDAVASFNAGSVATLKILDKMKIKHGKYTVLGCKESNDSRIKIQIKKAVKHLNIGDRSCVGTKRRLMIKILRLREKHMNLEDFRCIFNIFM